jgi:hypothetical protein
MRNRVSSWRPIRKKVAGRAEGVAGAAIRAGGPSEADSPEVAEAGLRPVEVGGRAAVPLPAVAEAQADREAPEARPARRAVRLPGVARLVTIP